MNKRGFLLLIIGLALIFAAIPLGIDPADAGPGTGATAALATPSGGTFFANSPNLRKFVDSLPGLGPTGANNLGQFIPVATPGALNGGDYYEIGLYEYREQMHSDLPPVVGAKNSPTATGGTKLRGYVQENGGTPVSLPHYLGPAIVANKNTPVRVKFTNRLPIGAAGDLMIPVDHRIMGAGMGPLDAVGAACDPMAVGANCASYTENRGVLHLHGGRTPWISDGTPHQWTVPAGEATPFLKGVSEQSVPDMPAAGAGELTYFYSNQQSSRLLFYHDHAWGITRLNVYAGNAAPYIIRDPAETALITGGLIPSGAAEVPLVIQDKTFVPQDIAVQDAKWNTAKWGGWGNLWFPHVYEINQWPGNPDGSGTNPFGRWDYGPYTWPIFQIPAAKMGVYTANDSIVPEAFHDNMVVNGTAYPYLNVDRKAYRFRVLNACNDRFLNLQLYYVDPNDPNGTEVRMVPANSFIQADLAADLGQGTTLYNGYWTSIDTRTVQEMIYSPGINTLYVNLGANGLWSHDGAVWTQISTTPITKMAATNSKLYVLFNPWGVWEWDGKSFKQVDSNNPDDIAATATGLYAQYAGWGIYRYNGTSWTNVSPNAATKMLGGGPNLYAVFQGYGLWKHDGATFTQIDWNTPLDMVQSSTVLYASYGSQGLYKYDGTTWTNISVNPVGAMTASDNSGDLYAGFGKWGLWHYDGTNWTQIDPKNTPTSMAASGTGLYCAYDGLGTWKYTPTAGFSQISSVQPLKLQPVNFVPHAGWPVDGRAGGVPDPNTAGPDLVLIGNESGFVPNPVTLPNRPIDYEYNRRSATVLNVISHTVFLGPAERADLIVDFSQVPAGSKLILYNDAPAPVPGFDTRLDYYTGNPDQTSSGGAPSTIAGFGPNTRTIMQFRVSNAAAAPKFNMTALQAAWPNAYKTAQPAPVVGQIAYNKSLGTTYVDQFAPLNAGSLVNPNFTFSAGTAFQYAPDRAAPTTLVPVAAGNTVVAPVISKAIIEDFDEYGRMNAQLGVELPFTSVLVQTTIPLKYIDPATETFAPDEVQIWKVVHNGVDTHAIHFHLFDVQLINRVGWDGTIKAPGPHEVGWKETVKINPLEDTIVAVHAPSLLAFTVPFAVPASNRLLDPSNLVNTTAQFSNIDPATGQAPAVTVSNVMTNFAWEYVWHCHLLGHEENDMMRPMIYNR